MSDRLRDLRQNAAAAHVVPLVLFVGLLGLVPLVAEEHSLAPWWRQHPEQWLYPLQVVLGGLLLAFWWRRYDFGRCGLAEWGWGIALGLVAGVLWVLPCELWHRLGLGAVEAEATTLWLPLAGEHPWFYFLGVAERADGFQAADAPFPTALALALRFLRAVVIVALVEEIFWRGFLMRRLAERGGEEWAEVPIGRPGWPAWAGSTGLAILAHAPVDWFSSLLFFSLGYALCVWRKSVLACVVLHGTTNLVMGLYAVWSGHAGLW